MVYDVTSNFYSTCFILDFLDAVKSIFVWMNVASVLFCFEKYLVECCVDSFLLMEMFGWVLIEMLIKKNKNKNCPNNLNIYATIFFNFWLSITKIRNPQIFFFFFKAPFCRGILLLYILNFKQSLKKNFENKCNKNLLIFLIITSKIRS